MPTSKSKVDAIILVGGFGTRLQKIISDKPKPLAPIGNTPFLDILLKQLSLPWIGRIIFAAGHMHKQISAYAKEKGAFVSIEESPLGTGGAAKKALELATTDDVLIMNGDSFFDLPLTRFLQDHKNSGASLSIACRKIEDAARFGTVELEESGAICSFKEKCGEKKRGIINGGLYLCHRHYLESFPITGPFSLEEDFFPWAVHQNSYGFIYEGTFTDIGTPDSYLKAAKLLSK